MFQFYGRSLNYALLSSALFRQLDNPKTHDEILKDEEDNQSSEGRKRVKAMFSYDEMGSISPQISLITSGAFGSCVIGFCVGGFVNSKIAFNEFIEAKRATKFLSKFDAQRNLQDKVTLTFISGGAKSGLWMGCFTAAFLGTVITMSTYRGKNTILDYIVGGSLLGTVYNFRHGPRPTISGCIVGGIFGAVAGGLMLGLFKAAGLTLEDIIQADAKFIVKDHVEFEQLRDDYRKTSDSRDINKFYERGETLTDDDTFEHPTTRSTAAASDK